MYLGFALLLAGWALFLATPWAWAGPIAFVAFITRFQIRPEERVIRAKFGHQFDEFSQRVRRWI
jgi:protein-S-isoprenylcysteine O-methyltransferase Ste14